ncbi:hypothetical protein BJY01DRAFT_170989 [Aspergillus pseudoustus]|uniref:CSC1/OSCA1-like N-terminal transmembrane domain-containing protein n=1 Tax=Aspergillus pseudoustus TaxID=1810923 RepID=A0ABR4KXV8_9EURO
MNEVLPEPRETEVEEEKGRYRDDFFFTIDDYHVSLSMSLASIMISFSLMFLLPMLRFITQGICEMRPLTCGVGFRVGWLKPYKTDCKDFSSKIFFDFLFLLLVRYVICHVSFAMHSDSAWYKKGFEYLRMDDVGRIEI